MSIISRKNRFVAFASILVFTLTIGLAATAQDKAKNEPAPLNANQVVGQTATLTASLIDAEKNAKEKTATVEVRLTGVELIDPAMTNKRPMKGQGHLHYQVDNGPVIATTAPKLSFHELSPGKHKIVIMLANNDHSPAGPQQTLEITVP
jgi:hypothetical protein